MHPIKVLIYFTDSFLPPRSNQTNKRQFLITVANSNLLYKTYLFIIELSLFIDTDKKNKMTFSTLGTAKGGVKLAEVEQK